MATEFEIIDDIFSQMSKDLSYKVPKKTTEQLIRLEAERKLDEAKAFTFRYGILKDKALGDVVDDQELWGCLQRVKKTTKSKSLKRKIALVAQAKLKGC